MGERQLNAMALNVRCSSICVAGAKDLATALAKMPQLNALTSDLLWNSVGAAVAKDLDPAVDGRRVVCLGDAAPLAHHLDSNEKPYKDIDYALPLVVLVRRYLKS